MVSKVRVYGKAQNRTALGIVNAYLVMYPQSTLEDLKKAFPNELNPDSAEGNIFVRPGDFDDKNFKGYFTADDEVLRLGDGSKAVLATVWTKASFDRIVSHAEQYGIEVAKFEAADKGFGAKGGYRLEYLNGYVPPAPTNKKFPWWIVILLFLLLGVGVFFLAKKPKVVEKEVITTVVVRDTVYIEKVAEIEAAFNATQFEQGKAELSQKAQFVLDDLASLMRQQTDLKLKIEGHTSSEGDPAFNQKLSEDRAKAAVDYIISKGIASDRLQFEGLGSTKPVDPNNADRNRRTEFIIIK